MIAAGHLLRKLADEANEPNAAKRRAALAASHAEAQDAGQAEEALLS
jgi:hypothetical protein